MDLSSMNIGFTRRLQFIFALMFQADLPVDEL